VTSTPTAIYARFSTDRQDARSIEDQERRCRRYAEERGWQVVQVYEDAAVSGTTIGRAGLQRLLADAKRFCRVLVDDLSRLSRDLVDTLTLTRQLSERGVEVIDCASGTSTADKNGKFFTVIQGLFNEQFIDDIRHKTHRGLEGRALKGFATGGRCYGYTTAPEPEPQDPKHVRSVILIDKPQAKVVRRIFAAFAAGQAPSRIAEKLNTEGIPAPYDGGAYQKPAGRGWGSGTVRAMLRNERYLGRLVWNKTKNHRGGPHRSRRHRPQPEAEWVRVERPELRIIDDVLWAHVQSRFGERRKLGEPRAKKPSPLSGLVRCGVCGSRMTLDIGTRDYRNFQCAANKTKGSAICPSAKRVSEQKVLGALVETVKGSLAHPQFRERFEATLKRLWAEAMRPAATETETDRQLRAQEARVNRLAALAADNPDIESLLGQLRAEETKMRALRQRAAASPAPRRAAPPYPTPEQLTRLWGDVEGTLLASPQEAKEVLAARFEPVVLTPRDDGWEMETAMRLGAAVDLKAPGPAALASGRAGLWPSDGCGGRI